MSVSFCNWRSVSLVISFDDGVKILAFANRDPVGICSGHPDWIRINNEPGLVPVIKAPCESNHSRGIYYLGADERILFPE